MSIPEFNVGLKTSLTTRYNRGEDTKHTTVNMPVPTSVGLLTVDTAIIKYLQTKIAPVVTQDNKQIQVPIIYGNPERWKSVQRDGLVRDQNGKIQLPMIMVRRTTMKKNATNSPINKYQNYVFKTTWNPRNIYDKFTALNGITPSEMYQSIAVPDHYDINYDAIIWTEYMEQLNKIVENISFESDEYWGDTNNYKFMSRISEFTQMDDVASDGERIVRNKFSITVRAYILPESMLNREGNREATTRVRYSPKKVVFDSEVVTSLNP